MGNRLRLTAGAGALVAAAVLLGGAPAAPSASAEEPVAVARAATTGANTDPNFVVAYTANVENLAGKATRPKKCRRAYTRLADYMAAQPLAPDFIAIQQVSDQTNLNKFIKALEARTGRPYDGFIAINPRPMGGGGAAGNCRTATTPKAPETDLTTGQKLLQTNAIIYRTGRFHLEGAKHTWKSDARFKAGGRCQNAADKDSSQDRTVNVAARFYDDKAEKYVTVASYHWPTGNVGVGDNVGCAPENLKELVEHTSDAKMGKAGLQVLGGDSNALAANKNGVREPWYTSGLQAYGLRDVVAERCTALALSVADCEKTNTTSPNQTKRIDYLWGDSASATAAGATVPYDAVGPVTKVQDHYSDHRAVQGYLYY